MPFTPGAPESGTRDAETLRSRRTQERLAHDEASLEMLAAHVPGVPSLPRLRFGLWALRHLPTEGTPH